MISANLPMVYYPVPGYQNFSSQTLDDAGKIFVGGIPADATKEVLTEYFSQFGEVSDCIIMVDNMTGRSRGFGFVTFLDHAAVEAVLSHTKHVVLGKIIDAKKAVPKGPNQSSILRAMGVATNRADRNPDCKVFVGGVAQGTTETDIASYFKIFGKVLEVKIPKDQNTQRARGFSFVLFDHPDSVIKATKEKYHTINNKMVEVKTVHISSNRNSDRGSDDDGNTQSPPSPYIQIPQSPNMYTQYGPRYVGIAPTPGSYYNPSLYEQSPSGSTSSVASMGSTGVGNIPPPNQMSSSNAAGRVDEYSQYAPHIYQPFSEMAISQQYHRRQGYPTYGGPGGQYSLPSDHFPSQQAYSPTPLQQPGYSPSPVPSSMAYPHAYGTSPPVYALSPAVPQHAAAQSVTAQYTAVPVSTPQQSNHPNSATAAAQSLKR